LRQKPVVRRSPTSKSWFLTNQIIKRITRKLWSRLQCCPKDETIWTRKQRKKELVFWALFWRNIAFPSVQLKNHFFLNLNSQSFDEGRAAELQATAHQHPMCTPTRRGHILLNLSFSRWKFSLNAQVLHLSFLDEYFREKVVPERMWQDLLHVCRKGTDRNARRNCILYVSVKRGPLHSRMSAGSLSCGMYVTGCHSWKFMANSASHPVHGAHLWLRKHFSTAKNPGHC